MLIDQLIKEPEGKTLEFKRDVSSPKPLLKSYRSVEGIAFDEMPMPDLSIDDLDLNAAKMFFADTNLLTEQTLLTLKLIARYQGKLVPTKGAILLFGKQRDLYFPDAWVQCGRFDGIDKATIFDHIDIHENLPKTVDSIMLFLKKHAMRTADFTETRRKDVWSIPLGILREAVINALVHADYSQRGAPIRIAFFDDRIEIENPGILLPGMTVEDMLQGVSKIRNHIIARVFRELNLIEQWGSGVRRIFKEAAALKLPEPQIIEFGMCVRVIIYLSKKMDLIAKKTSTDQVRLELRLESRLESKFAAKVLIQLEYGAAGKMELAKAFGHKTVSGELHKQIKILLSHQLVEMTIPEKPNSRMQKYRLTNEGRHIIAKI